ncbi:MAG: peptide chain release factor 1 [candidate division Zixibacteria bacterium 4484_95]|nr:MAG: peptide chain release factor 1 [candidate division Zixibacteria bacterium 4484_95]
MKFSIINLLEPLKKRLKELDEELTDTKVLADQKFYKKIAKERSDVEETVNKGEEYSRLLKSIEDNEQLIKEDPDSELAQLAHEELEGLMAKKQKLEKELELRLIPKDPDDSKNVIMEIRAGTGGEEAALFVADLFRMYSRFAEQRGWHVDVMNSNITGVGGFKEIIFSIEGDGIFGDLKFESGVHRVQRVPATEASGRLHTSAASVVVLPEAEDVELNIDPLDLRIDVFRASGPGGQHVNTTDSAVRITHIPTNTVVTCQDEKSQHKNKTKALKVLRARLLDKLNAQKNEQISKTRKSMVGSGDRSEKIRTYNFPQNRVTDHRIGLTLYDLENIINGKLDELIAGAKKSAFEKKIKMVKENQTKV